MNWLPEHKCGLYLTHNEHRDYYEPLTLRYDDPSEWVSPEEYQRSLETDSVWTLQWYPETPVGFCLVRASSLEAIRAALEAEG